MGSRRVGAKADWMVKKAGKKPVRLYVKGVVSSFKRSGTATQYENQNIVRIQGGNELLPRQEDCVRVQGADREEGLEVPVHVGCGSPGARQQWGRPGELQEEPPPESPRRAGARHALPELHLSAS